MTITTDARYDLATLQRARGDSPLEVRQGLATAYHWTARAEPSLDVALAADGRPARTMTAVLSGLGPGQRAAWRALLEDAQQALDRPTGLGTVPLAINQRHSTRAALGLRGERHGVALRLDQAHAALIREGDTLLAARRRPSVYVLVVRDGTVLAAIRATPAPGTTTDHLRRHLPVIPAGR
jgi:hypothetical protein